MVVRAGNSFYVRGQTAMNLCGEIVGAADPAAQAENAMECAKVVLEQAGSCLAEVVWRRRYSRGTM
jgi:enamine deaminase RidA (YjgF/YER057c/UK114 family)